ncbi:DNA adenine methylase [Hydrogenophaga bisanensis]|uniref:site-specific DNA-methyltransferase (adenine-specific) n=1 Tax=Hydrogenophaga bisanensis TaxID=439611 RepID=A0ABW2RBV1_9BURK
MGAEPQTRETAWGKFTTPLRYPGGKGRLGPWIAEIMRHNRISGGWYIEPYAGGAGAALFLLTQGYVDHIVINDADPIVYAFWKAATERNAELLAKIQKTPVTMETWRRQREVIAAPEKHNLVEVAFATFFLNRTNRSGILSAGVIGGKAQTGDYKLDARYNVADLMYRIKTIGAYKSRMTVLGIDALDLLTDVAPGFPRECLVYLDPPYYVKGSLLYRNHYVHEDHAAIAECVADAAYPLIVTYDDCYEVRQLYSSFESTNFELHYSTHSARPLTSEILFYRNIELPSAPAMTRATHLAQHARTKGAIASQKTLSA